MPARLCPRLSDISVYSGVYWHRTFAIFVLRSLLNHSHYIQVFFPWQLPGRHLKLSSSSGQRSLACEWRRRSGARCLFAKWGMEVKKTGKVTKTCFHLLRAIQIVKLCWRFHRSTKAWNRKKEVKETQDLNRIVHFICKECRTYFLLPYPWIKQ